MFSWKSLSGWTQFLDIVIILLAIFYIVIAFRLWYKQKEKNRDREANERDRAASAIGTALVVFTTADSILLTGVGILSQLQVNGGTIPTKMVTQLLISGIFFVIAIIFGVLAATYVLNHIHHKQSVVENYWIMGFAVGQFSATLFGSLLLIIALFLL